MFNQRELASAPSVAPISVIGSSVTEGKLKPSFSTLIESLRVSAHAGMVTLHPDVGLLKKFCHGVISLLALMEIETTGISHHSEHQFPLCGGDRLLLNFVFAAADLT